MELQPLHNIKRQALWQESSLCCTLCWRTLFCVCEMPVGVTKTLVLYKPGWETIEWNTNTVAACQLLSSKQDMDTPLQSAQIYVIFPWRGFSCSSGYFSSCTLQMTLSVVQYANKLHSELPQLMWSPHRHHCCSVLLLPIWSFYIEFFLWWSCW